MSINFDDFYLKTLKTNFLKKGSHKTEQEIKTGNVSTNFNAYETLGKEGKEFLEKIGGQMRTDLPKISELMSQGIENNWITLRERGEIIEILGKAKTPNETGNLVNRLKFLQEIHTLLEGASNKNWITNKEKDFILQSLEKAEDNGDLFKILQEVQSICKDPVLKKPDDLEIKIEQKEEIQQNLQKLSEVLERSFSNTNNGSFYVTDDNGMSIVFIDSKDNKVSTAFTRQELIRILLSAGDMDLYHFFSDLMKLPKATTEDFKEAKKVKEIREKDRQIVEDLAKIPVLTSKNTPNISGKKTTEVIQGAGSGQFVTNQEADFIGTNGMGPCVALLICQDFGDKQKAVCIHVDSFSGKASLGVQGSAPLLDRYIGSEFIKNPSLQIHLIGANQGGRENVLEIYKYLEQKSLTENIVSANVLGKGQSGNVVLDVKTGQVYTGIANSY